MRAGLVVFLAGIALGGGTLDRHPWSASVESVNRCYVVETNTFPELADALAAQLERAYTFFQDRFGPLEGRDRRRMRVTLFRTRREYLEHGGGVEGAIGHFDAALDRCALVWRGETGETGWPVAVHEACHHYLRRRHPQYTPPSWYGEGIACYFEGLLDPTTVRDVSRLRIHAAQAALRAGAGRLEPLLGARARVDRGKLELRDFTPTRFYGLAWSLVHFLATDARYRDGFRRFELRLFAAHAHADARESHARRLLEEECGDLALLERRWLAHVRALPLPPAPAAAPVYAWELGSPRAYVRFAALRRLGADLPPDLRPGVLGAQGDGDLVVRKEACRVLARHMDQDAVVGMILSLDLGDEELKGVALKALALPGATMAVPRLLRETEDRIYAVRALAEIGDPRAFPPARRARRPVAARRPPRALRGRAGRGSRRPGRARPRPAGPRARGPQRGADRARPTGRRGRTRGEAPLVGPSQPAHPDRPDRDTGATTARLPHARRRGGAGGGAAAAAALRRAPARPAAPGRGTRARAHHRRDPRFRARPERPRPRSGVPRLGGSLESRFLPELVDTRPALQNALARLRDAPAVALDTETDAFFAYRPRICLLQLSVPGTDLLVDPLADLDLAPLGEALADAGREVVLHAAENDIILLHHQFRWRLANLYDTQVACFVLGLKPYSLAGVLEARFGVKLDKRQQRSDWSRRPLSTAQITYAADDTRHLLDLAKDLKERAAQAGRSDEIAAECRRIAGREWTPEPFDPEGFRRLSGARDLDGIQLRVLRELYLFRAGEAERRNRAPYRVCPDAALIRLATDRRLPPKGVPAAFWRRYEKKIRALLEDARRAGPLPPRRPRRGAPGERMAAGAKQRFEELRKWRTAAAEKRGVEGFVVARNELLEKIARADCRTLEELGELVEPFRLREYGAAILAAMLDSRS